MSRALYWLTPLVLLMAFGTHAEERVLWNEVITVPAGQSLYKAIPVPVPLINGRIAGSFQAAGGAGNDITFRLIDAEAFKAFSARVAYPGSIQQISGAPTL